MLTGTQNQNQQQFIIHTIDILDVKKILLNIPQNHSDFAGTKIYIFALT